MVELEKTIGLMKKVVERVQRENEQLKKAPGVVSNHQLEELQQENLALKVPCWFVSCAICWHLVKSKLSAPGSAMDSSWLHNFYQDRLHDVSQQIGGQLSRRYEAKTQSMAKLVAEVERLKKELAKRGTASDKTRAAKEATQVKTLSRIVFKKRLVLL